MRPLAELRAETPGVQQRIHLNNAGAALMPQPVLDAVHGHLELEALLGGYEAADAVQAQVDATYASLARLIGSEPGNVALVEHATRGFVEALSSIPMGKGDLLLTSIQDYNSNQIQYLSLADRFGIRIEHAPHDEDGVLDAAATVERIHRLRPRVVALTEIPTSSGAVQPLDGIGAACRKADAWFIVDACQSLGQIPVDVGELGCDFLSTTARKFLRGPRGAGFLYVSDRALDAGLMPLFPDLRGADWIERDLVQPAPDARRFESWEFAWSLVLGLGAAADYALAVGVEEGGVRACDLAATLRTRLERIDGVRVLDQGARLGAIVTLSIGGRERVLMQALRERGINTSWQDRVQAVMDFDRKGVEEILRVSPHYYNTEEELDRFLHALQELIAAG